LRLNNQRGVLNFISRFNTSARRGQFHSPIGDTGGGADDVLKLRSLHGGGAT
jgi:hypothetical protein